MSRRDRHGRGLRAPLVPAAAPGWRSRRAAFDEAVVAVVERLHSRWADSWGRIDFAVEDVPPSAPARWEDGVPLGRLFPADAGQPTRIVVYRRPIEQRAPDAAAAGALARDVVIENLAHLWGREPHEVDPDYGR